MGKSREKQLVKNTGILALGKICTQFVSFFLLPLYTALLSTKEYGTVDILNTYISLLIPLVFFQIDQAIFRFLIDVREDEDGKSNIISTAIITVSVQAILYILVYLVVSIFIDNEYKYFLAFNVVASMFSNILLQICRGLGDNTNYSLGSLVAGISTIVLNILFIAVFKWGAYGMLSATLLANILCALFIFFRKKIYKYLSIKRYNKEERKKLWKYSIPLIPNQLSWWVVNVSDRTIITNVLGLAANGIYSASNKFSTICTTVFNIFNLTWSESASMHIKDGDASVFFSNIVNTAIKLFTSICLGVVALMPFCFRFLITGSGYQDAYYQIPVLMLGTIFSVVVSLIGSIYIALKKSNEIAKTSIYAAIINIVINILLIKRIGLYAASVSTLVAYFVMAFYRYIDVQKYVKIKLDVKMMIISLFVAAFVIVVYYIRNTWLCILGLIVIVVYFYISNRKLIGKFINIFKKKIKKA